MLVDNQGNILYVSEYRTGKYLEPAAGKANWNIFAMAREDLRYELGNAFQKAIEQEATVITRRLEVGTNGGKQHVGITVQVLQQPESLRKLLLIVFTDIAVPLELKPEGLGGKGGKKPARNPGLDGESGTNTGKLRLEACKPSARRCKPHRRNSGPPTRSSNP